MRVNKLSKYCIIIIAVLAVWIKTVVVQLTSFDLGLESGLQQFILWLSPLSFLLIVFSLAFLFKKPVWRNGYILSLVLILDFVLYGNVGFYRFFTDFVTIPVLSQTSNFGDLGSSVTEIVRFSDVFFFIDFFIVLIAIKFLPQTKVTFTRAKRFVAAGLVLAGAIFAINLYYAEKERPQLLTRSFDRNLLVKNLGIYNYHLYDVYTQMKASTQRAMADSNELSEIVNFTRANETTPNAELFGKYEGRNVILVSMESLQSFVINNEMNGQEITPFLNELTKDQDTYYFSDFYHQTGLGKTSDSEFIVENSIFGSGNSSVFFTNGENTYNSMAEKLGENGYFTSVLHANNKSFWNRDRIYQSLKIDKFYDVESYEVNDENSVNWGMKDIPFFEQSAAHMAEMPQPFYSRLITLTNHHPFYLDEEDKFIEEYNSNSGTLNRYFQTVRYMDESLRLFFDNLKEQGIYENSIIVMYGDHYGISENHNKAMAMYLEKEEITHFDTALLQSVPFFIHIPGSGDGQEITKTAGQLDVRPTVLSLLGIETTNDIQLGNDIFSDDYEDLVVFRDGGFITKDLVYTKDVCYDRETGDATDKAVCEPYIDRANTELRYSDEIIIGDLLRFYDAQNGTLLE